MPRVVVLATFSGKMLGDREDVADLLVAGAFGVGSQECVEVPHFVVLVAARIPYARQD